MLNLNLWVDLYLVGGLSPIDFWQMTDEEQVACASALSKKIKDEGERRKREKDLEDRANFYKNGGM